MSEDAIAEIARILEETEDADEALIRVVARIVEEPDTAWAGVAFVEDRMLALGPSTGDPDASARIRTPIEFQGDLVGELVVHGAGDPAALARVADLIAPYVLIGWDTGGEAWEP